jgi:hypothetical protein
LLGILKVLLKVFPPLLILNSLLLHEFLDSNLVLPLDLLISLSPLQGELNTQRANIMTVCFLWLD